MDSLAQMNEIVDILIDLDDLTYNEKETINTYNKMIQLVQNALYNQQIYGDVRNTLETIINNHNNQTKINYGLIAAEIAYYL